MGIKYFQADDIKARALDVVQTLNWSHIDFNHLGFLRSHGSSAPRTIARCHALGKAMQMAMGRTKGFYLIEVISEKFDRLSQDEQTKTIIHELLHIPKTFGGGFIHHDMVHEKNVRTVFDYYNSLKRKNVINMLNTPTGTPVQEKIDPSPLMYNLALKKKMFKMEKKFRWF
jgi:predicted metallopeptidase